LIAEEGYFVLHAPRQTGKTSCLLALMEQLNVEEDYTAFYVNLEPPQAARGDVEAGMRTIVSGVAQNARQYLGDQRPREWVNETLHEFGLHGALQGLLSRWSEENDRPIVLLLDEVDSLVGDTLISLLRQIQAGYPDRPGAFPQTVLLCGVQDYRIHNGDKQVITGGSAFNIKSKSLRLGNFSHGDIATLYAQHTEATGQTFEAGVVEMSSSRPAVSRGWSMPSATRPVLKWRQAATAAGRLPWALGPLPGSGSSSGGMIPISISWLTSCESPGYIGLSASY